MEQKQFYYCHEEENYPFPAEEYSWFKFGDKYFAEKFAKELFEQLSGNGFFKKMNYPDVTLINLQNGTLNPPLRLKRIIPLKPALERKIKSYGENSPELKRARTFK